MKQEPSNFYDSRFCLQHMNCKQCRDTGKHGRNYRRAMVEKYVDLTDENYDCPVGLPWDMGRDQKVTPDSLFVQARNAILSAPDEGTWRDLKRELRLMDEAVVLHGKRLGGCWMRRQMRRVCIGLRTAEKKGLIEKGVTA